MIGIRLSWECVNCGNVIKTVSPFWDAEVRKKIVEPKRCGCGRKGEFRLLNFSRCTYLVLPEGTRIVDKDGNTVYEENSESTEAEESGLSAENNNISYSDDDDETIKD